MHQIVNKLWVGSQADFERLDQPFGTEWAVVFAARDPWHRRLLGYTGRGAPPDHPEYLFARRGNRLYLNLVDAADPKYISRATVDEAMRFIHEYRGSEAFMDPANPNAVVVVCNQGCSRSSTIAMLAIAAALHSDFEIAEGVFRERCPTYAPGTGMRDFARQNWAYYESMRWLSPAAGADPESTALDKAHEVWQRFCKTLATDPDLARDQLIKSIVQALSAAHNAGPLDHGRQDPSSTPR